jgi:hypothetical protein
MNRHDATKRPAASALVHDSSALGEFVHVFGDVDFSAAGELEAMLVANGLPGRALYVKLTDCRFIDAAAAGVLQRAKARMGDSMLIEACAGSIPARVLQMLGMEQTLLMPPSVAVATAPLRSDRGGLRRGTLGQRDLDPRRPLG